jgi:hypothetical protein
MTTSTKHTLDEDTYESVEDPVYYVYREQIRLLKEDLRNEQKDKVRMKERAVIAEPIPILKKRRSRYSKKDDLDTQDKTISILKKRHSRYSRKDAPDTQEKTISILQKRHSRYSRKDDPDTQEKTISILKKRQSRYSAG